MKTETNSGPKPNANPLKTSSTSARSGKHQQIEKMTRWDRITKKHLNTVNVQTAQVRRIFDLNFVSGDQMQHMSGRGDVGAVSGRSGGRRRCLDPALVMDMRHEIIRRNRPAEDNVANNALKALKLERVRSHNQRLDQRYVDQEIEKFRKSLHSQKRTEVVVRLNNYQSDTRVRSPLLLKDYNFNSPLPEDNKLDTLNQVCESDGTQFCKEPDTITKPHLQDEYILHDDQVSDLGFYRARCAAIEAKGLHDAIPSQVYDPFDDNVDDTKVVRFEHFVKEVNSENMYNSDDDSSCITSLISSIAEDPVASENYEPKTPPQLQLFGTHIETPKPNPSKHITESSTSSTTICGAPLPLLTVSNVLLYKSPAAMTITMMPKCNEVPSEQNEIIAELFSLKHNETLSMDTSQLMRKYFQRWVHITTATKIGVDNECRDVTRQLKINTFLQNIRQEKHKQSMKGDVSEGTTLNCKHVAEAPNNMLKKHINSKLKMQRDIIELQKIKLERQERMIAELKLNRLTEATQKSQAAAKEELRNVIRHGNAKLRSTARCLQLVGNLREKEDESAADEFAKLQAKGVPKFLVDMQTRAMERNARHQEARDRRERLEREKEEQRLAAEAAKLKQDEEAKRQRMEELREKRKLERALRQQRDEERIRYLQNMQKAVAFNRRRLLRRYGLDRFQALIKLKRRNQRKAEMFRVFIILRSTFAAWRKYVVEVWAERKRQADEFQRLRLLRMGMDGWKRYQALQNSKLLVAIDWYDVRLAERVFRAWDNYTRHQRCIEEVKMRQAESHYNWHLKWRVIEHWQRLHAILQLERETDERRQKWRLKIWELLPDYQPAPLDDIRKHMKQSK